MRLSLLSWSAAVLLVFGLMTPPQLPAKDKSDAPAAKEDGKGPKEAPADAKKPGNEAKVPATSIPGTSTKKLAPAPTP